MHSFFINDCDYHGVLPIPSLAALSSATYRINPPFNPPINPLPAQNPFDFPKFAQLSDSQSFSEAKLYWGALTAGYGLPTKYLSTWKLGSGAALSLSDQADLRHWVEARALLLKSLLKDTASNGTKWTTRKPIFGLIDDSERRNVMFLLGSAAAQIASVWALGQRYPQHKIKRLFHFSLLTSLKFSVTPYPILLFGRHRPDFLAIGTTGQVHSVEAKCTGTKPTYSTLSKGLIQAESVYPLPPLFVHSSSVSYAYFSKNNLNAYSVLCASVVQRSRLSQRSKKITDRSDFIFSTDSSYAISGAYALAVWIFIQPLLPEKIVVNNGNQLDATWVALDNQAIGMQVFLHQEFIELFSGARLNFKEIFELVDLGMKFKALDNKIFEGPNLGFDQDLVDLEGSWLKGAFKKGTSIFGNPLEPE